MTPTIGRIVYYKALNDETYAAIITEVQSLNRVSLTVFYPDHQKTLRYVPHDANGADPGTGQGPGTWDWMPYQKQQAEKNSAGT